jgi:pyruvate/2-oxoglutarate/acetoin dehydrogenase E1 component
MTQTTYKQAISRAIFDVMKREPKSLVLGQDIGAFSILGVTSGLVDAFGPDRVRDCPISESAMVGLGVGAAMAGYKTLIEIAYADIIAVAFASVVHSAAKLPFASNGRLACPVIVRAPIGRFSRHGPMGTEVTASWFYNVPDLAIAMPATVNEAYWQLCAAYERAIPTVFLEDKSLYGKTGTIVGRPSATTTILRPGNDVTIVAAGRTVWLAEQAAESAASAQKVSAEIISLAAIKPLDVAPIIASVRRTGRLLVVQDEPPLGGYGADLLARAATGLIGPLRAPARLVSRADTFLPYLREEDHLPTCAAVETALLEMAR